MLKKIIGAYLSKKKYAIICGLVREDGSQFEEYFNNEDEDALETIPLKIFLETYTISSDEEPISFDELKILVNDSIIAELLMDFRRIEKLLFICPQILQGYHNKDNKTVLDLCTDGIVGDINEDKDLQDIVFSFLKIMALRGDKTDIQYIKEKFPFDLNLKDEEGKTVFDYAIEAGYYIPELAPSENINQCSVAELPQAEQNKNQQTCSLNSSEEEDTRKSNNNNNNNNSILTFNSVL